jgi:hypothetical protein
MQLKVPKSVDDPERSCNLPVNGQFIGYGTARTIRFGFRLQVSLAAPIIHARLVEYVYARLAAKLLPRWRQGRHVDRSTYATDRWKSTCHRRHVLEP